MVRFPLKEVQSTRTLRPTSGSSYPYVEIMIGDLLNQRLTQLQLEQVCVYVFNYCIFFFHCILLTLNVFLCVCVCVLQGLELCRVIAMYMENMLSVREKRLTLPPSEITLL